MFKYKHLWEKLYNDIKGGSWPQEIPLEVDFYQLPQYMQERFLEVGYDPSWSGIKRWNTTGPNKFSVFYSDECDGGGTLYSDDYVENIKEYYSNQTFDRCYEWCSGPGFIGFNLLSHGICNSLCLTDIYLPALDWAEETKLYKPNNIANKVDTYLIKDLALLPSTEQFNLVVANPPHSNSLSSNILSHNLNRIVTDVNWDSHRNFYKNIKSHLSEDGIILLLENHGGSTVEDFIPMIEENGLTVKDSWNSKTHYSAPTKEWSQNNADQNQSVQQIYYIEIVHK